MVLERYISESQYFHVKDGSYLLTIVALRAALRSMRPEQFSFHVRIDKQGIPVNDFADWVQHVFDEPELAKRLRACTTKEMMGGVLDEIFATEVRERSRRMQDSLAMATTTAIPQSSSSTQSPQMSPSEYPREPIQQPISGSDWTDESFAPIRREMNERNEKLGDKYDEITKRLQGAFDDPMSRSIEQRAEKLMGRYNDVLVRISEERRGGHDMFFPSLMIKQFPAKLTLANATRQESDFAIAGIVLDQVEYAIREVLENDGLDVKKQVMAMAGIVDKQPADNDVRKATAKTAVKTQ